MSNNVYIYIHIFLHVYGYMYIYTHTYTLVCTYMCICVYVYLYVSMFIASLLGSLYGLWAMILGIFGVHAGIDYPGSYNTHPNDAKALNRAQKTVMKLTFGVQEAVFKCWDWASVWVPRA